MKQFLDFIVDHWEVIFGILCTVVGFFVSLVRKKPTVSSTDIYLYAVSTIVDAVKDAEKLYKSGDEKLSYVMQTVKSKLTLKYDINFTDYKAFCEKTIERILSTPCATIYDSRK